jgi:hypothetical protein
MLACIRNYFRRKRLLAQKRLARQQRELDALHARREEVMRNACNTQRPKRSKPRRASREDFTFTPLVDDEQTNYSAPLSVPAASITNTSEYFSGGGGHFGGAGASGSWDDTSSPDSHSAASSHVSSDTSGSSSYDSSSSSYDSSSSSHDSSSSSCDSSSSSCDSGSSFSD